MIEYETIHRKTEQYIAQKLKKQGYKKVLIESRIKKDTCIFDVYNQDTDTAYEVLTAKIVRSAHEQDEAIISKMFRYLLHCLRLKFYLASYNHEEIEMFHDLRLEHWHLNFDWSDNIIKTTYHKGKKAEAIACKIFNLLIGYAPLKEWTREKRRKKHPKPEEFEKLTKEYGLPEHFLVGLWRDWRLMWVWKLEKILPKWVKRFKAICPRYLKIKPH